VLGLDFSASVGPFLTGSFEFIFKTLSSLAGVPADAATCGIGVLFDGTAGLLKNVPALGAVCFELLLLGKSILQRGLEVHGLSAENIVDIFSEIKNATDVAKSPEGKRTDEKAATENLLRLAKEKGGSDLEAAVSQVLAGKDPDGVMGTPSIRTEALPPGADQIGASAGDLDRILGIGLPVAGALMLALV